MSTATENFEAGVAALGLLDGGHADHQQAMRYFTAASDLDPAMCDAWLGRMLCGDNASGTMYRAWRARQQMHAQVSRMGITAAQLWPRFDIGMGIVALEQPIYDQSALAAALASSLAMGNPPDYAEAVDALAEATPTSVTAWVKAAIYYRAQRWPDVIDTLSEHLGLFDRDAVLKVAVQLALGIAHAYLGQFDKAAGYLRTVAEQTTLSEAVPVAQWFSALIARERGDEDTAKDLMRKVNAAAPSSEVTAALEDTGIRLQLTTIEAIAERTDPWDPATGPSSADLVEARAATERAEKLAEATAELDAQVGMYDLKEQVRTFRSRIRMAEKRRKLGLKTPAAANHMIFAGPPGTGKTTVANVIAKILCGLGIVKTSKVVSVSAKQLIGQHLGDSEAKTEAVVAKALDGVLFLDEFYALVSAENKGSNADAFGKAVIDTLLTHIENDRHRLVVIIAGYENEIDQVLATNEGMATRFAHRFRFTTYTPDELVAIAHALAAGRDDTLAAETIELLRTVCMKLSALSTTAQNRDPVELLDGVLAALRDSGADTERRNAVVRYARDQLAAIATPTRSAIDIVGNGRFVRKVLENAADARDVRNDEALSGEDDDGDEELLMTIAAPDMARALQKILAAESSTSGLDLTTVLAEVD